jgi:hypothetical protein
MRISVRLSQNQFVAATFLLDTGCCPHFNLSTPLSDLIASRIEKDVGEDFLQTTIDGKNYNCIVKCEVPEVHHPANIMGLPMFFAMGLSFNEGTVHKFLFDKYKVARNIGSHKLSVI